MKKYSGILLLFSLLVSGCGLSTNQRNAASRFASASSGLGDFAATEFSSLRAANITMNTKDIAIGGTAKLANIDGAFTVENVQARILAATALSAYGNLLLALVNETDSANLNNASDQFVASIKNLPNQKLDNQQLNSIGAIVYDLGDIYLEEQKAKAVRKIVNEAKADIDRILDLLIQDFNPAGLNLAQGINATILRLKADADIALATSGNNVQNKLIAIDAYSLANEQDEKTKSVNIRAAAALTALKAANTELVNTFNNDQQSSSELAALALQMNNLGTTLKVFDATH
jgi:hypothetical protein